MRLTRLAILGLISTVSLGLTGCGSITRGLGSFSSEGLVDEYSIPQNRSLAMPSDFSMLPVPQNQQSVQASLPTPDEIESLMFQLEPEAEPEYVPITIIQGELPEYRPIGRIVASGSNGAAAQAFVSPSTNAGGSLYPVFETSEVAPSAPTVTSDFVFPADPGLVSSTAGSAPAPVATDGLTVLSAEDVAALSALAVGQAVPANGASQTATSGAQVVTSLPAGVTVVGSPVVLPR